MTQLDPSIVAQYAEHLQRRASSRIMAYTISIALVGSVVGSVPLVAPSRVLIPHYLGVALLLVGAAAGGYLGYTMGVRRAEGFRLQALMALHQIQVEHALVHPAPAVLAAPAPASAAPAAPVAVTHAPVVPAPVPVAPAPALVPPAPLPAAVATPAASPPAEVVPTMAPPAVSPAMPPLSAPSPSLETPAYAPISDQGLPEQLVPARTLAAAPPLGSAPPLVAGPAFTPGPRLVAAPSAGSPPMTPPVSAER
jgi:hypothetical protein